MDNVFVVMYTVGAIAIASCLGLGFIHLCSIWTVRLPKPKTFSNVQRVTLQFQTVAGPAVAALFASFLASLSSSFFYSAFTITSVSWHLYVGLAILFAGIITLIVTLHLVLKDAGEASVLTRDPFTIRAAADEYAENPRRSSLESEFLRQQLEDWAVCISAHSLELSTKRRTRHLERILGEAAEKNGFFASLLASLKVYFAAVREFPLRFGWPFLGVIFLVSGTVLNEGRNVTEPWAPWVIGVVLTVVGGVATMFYCATRGNHVRLRHRINLVGLGCARTAIDVAVRARTRVEDQDAAVLRVLERADNFLQEDILPSHSEKFILSLGRIRIAISTNTRRR